MSALSYPPGLLRIHNSRHQEKGCWVHSHRPRTRVRTLPESPRLLSVPVFIPAKLRVLIQQLKNQFGSSPFILMFQTRHRPLKKKKRRPGNRVRPRRRFSGEDEVASRFRNFAIVRRAKTRRRGGDVFDAAPGQGCEGGYSRVIHLRRRIHYTHESSSPRCSITLARGPNDAFGFPLFCLTKK